jgi:hypothetical protein
MVVSFQVVCTRGYRLRVYDLPTDALGAAAAADVAPGVLDPPQDNISPALRVKVRCTHENPKPYASVRESTSPPGTGCIHPKTDILKGRAASYWECRTERVM